MVAVWYKRDFADTRPLADLSNAFGVPDMTKPIIVTGYIQDLPEHSTPSQMLHCEKYLDDFCEFIVLPCGKCRSCRMNKASEWSFRNWCEFKAHGEVGSFLTLTFSPDKIGDVLPMVNGRYSLTYKPFQNFMKLLRNCFPAGSLRFFMCGEYGTQYQRPHYHCLLYGVDLCSMGYVWRASVDALYYRSSLLESCWKHGFSLVGQITEQSINYVSRYCMKKVTGACAMGAYDGISPEFVHMSLKPGIGAAYYNQFVGKDFSVVGDDGTVGRDFVRYCQRKLRVPRYYDKLMQRGIHFRHYATLKEYRESKSESFGVSSDDFLRQDRYLDYLCSGALDKGVTNV